MKKKVLFAYVTEENKSYLEQKGKELNIGMSSIIDSLVSAYKENKKVSIKKRGAPVYVERAKKWLEKNPANAG